MGGNQPGYSKKTEGKEITYKCRSIMPQKKYFKYA